MQPIQFSGFPPTSCAFDGGPKETRRFTTVSSVELLASIAKIERIYMKLDPIFGIYFFL